MNDVDRFADSLIEGRSPEGFQPSDEEAAQMRTAIELRAGRADDGVPSEEILSRLRRELERPAKLRTRRRVVQTAGIAAASLAAGVGIDSVVRSSPPEENGTWRTVVASGDLADGEVREFEFGTFAGFVQRTGEGLRAVSSVCTHLGCRLRLQAKELECPCHGATFALDGEVVHYDLPIELPPLPHYAVREQNGVVQVRDS